jgi:S1-C subfamily serine protease
VFVELWDDNPMINKPMCRAQVKDLPQLREGGQNEIWCDSGARVQLGVEPAKGLIGLGLYYESRGTEGVRVTRVIEHSPASRAGLRGGDRILAINGKDVKKLDGNQIRSAINQTAKTGIKLDVWYQNGKRHVVEIKEGALYPLPNDEIPVATPQK